MFSQPSKQTFTVCVELMECPFKMRFSVTFPLYQSSHHHLFLVCDSLKVKKMTVFNMPVSSTGLAGGINPSGLYLPSFYVDMADHVML